MEKTSNIKFKIDKSLFWDVEIDNVDYNKYARHIINRILMRGNINDWLELKKFYGKDRIKTEMLKMRYLDKRTLNFCSFYFNIPKTKFKCYNTPQSIQELWDF
jgi:hypothetical protein